MEKICQECGDPIIGRSDKKFCGDYCRNTYNNNLKRSSNKLIRNTNNRLKKNYRILEELNPNGKSRTTRLKLRDHGFDFDLFTSIYTTKKGSTYFFVYDMGYLPLENEFFMLVRRDN